MSCRSDAIGGLNCPDKGGFSGSAFTGDSSPFSAIMSRNRRNPFISRTAWAAQARFAHDRRMGLGTSTFQDG
jgi:hypothetical protein